MSEPVMVKGDSTVGWLWWYWWGLDAEVVMVGASADDEVVMRRLLACAGTTGRLGLVYVGWEEGVAVCNCAWGGIISIEFVGEALQGLERRGSRGD